MNVDTISPSHWQQLTAVAIPLAKALRKEWMLKNKLNTPRTVVPLGVLLQLEHRNRIQKQVGNKFYDDLYSTMTAGLRYENNLPGEPDAAWERLVALWQVTENTQQINKLQASKGLTEGQRGQLLQRKNVPEPASNTVWILDQDSAQCATQNCGRRFGVFTRKHHCRLCGKVFCDKCTGRQLDIRNPLSANGRVQGLQPNQKVCDGCYDFWITLRNDLARGTPTTEVQVQISGKSGTPGARLYENFNSGAETVSRFQFVVTEGGGIVLLSRLDRAFKAYFHAYPDARMAFNCFKIFGEAQGRGRSDSCVIYLTQPFSDRRVMDFWHFIQSRPEQRDFKASIATNFRAPGLNDMGGGAWGIDLPDKVMELRLLGSNCDGSAGGLIRRVLGCGYANAALFFHDKPDERIDERTLTEKARDEVRSLVRNLYHLPNVNRIGRRIG
jgi:hypothetical protein